MDVLERVREVNAGASLTEERLSGARARLLDGIDARRAKAQKRIARRPVLLLTGAVGAAAAVTVAVLVTNGLSAPVPEVEALPTREPGPVLQPSVTPEPTVAPTPEPLTPASVLVGAATVIGDDPGPVAGPGQYLRIEHQIRNLKLYSPQGPAESTRAQATAAWVSVSSQTWYIPADRAGEWVQVLNPDLQVVELFGGDAGTRSEEWLAQFSWQVEPQILRYEGGTQPGTPVPNQTYAHYSEMPRDPAALLAWTKAYLQGGEPGGEDFWAAMFLIEELQQGSAPADLRAAMYRALSLIPGATIAGVGGDIVTISFSGQPQVDRSYSMTIDTRTAQVVSTTMNDGPRGTLVPDSVPDHQLTTTVSVVDAAP